MPMLHFIYGGLCMNKVEKIYYESPIGIVEIAGDNKAIHSILFIDQDVSSRSIPAKTPKVLIDCYEELDEYFKGERQSFTFPLAYDGTDFQKSVWNALTKINYAETCSYRDIAVSIGNEKAVRAVGTANGKNKLSIVIPCHRIIGANGTLTGYAGGLWRKEWLLNHEKANKK